MTADVDSKDGYGLSSAQQAAEMAAPELDYQPPKPRSYLPAIGLIGCGGISEQHLSAYRSADFRVVAACGRSERKGSERQREFFPGAEVYTDP
ncbi:MAG: hypothetical protein WKF84_28530 [Pyrinomonadaceae bacterium]